MTTFASILQNYGEPAILCSGGETAEIKVFINPIITNRSDKTWRGMTPLGEREKARFYCFGPAEHKVSDCKTDSLTVGGVRYEFVRAETYRVLGTDSHWEAVLKLGEVEFNGE